jgi:hypothetical protein
MGRCCSFVSFNAVSAAPADLTAASAALRVDSSVVAKMAVCFHAMSASRNVAAARTTVATAKTASGRHLQNCHHGGTGGGDGGPCGLEGDACNWPSMRTWPDTETCGGCGVSISAPVFYILCFSRVRRALSKPHKTPLWKAISKSSRSIECNSSKSDQSYEYAILGDPRAASPPCPQGLRCRLRPARRNWHRRNARPSHRRP